MKNTPLISTSNPNFFLRKAEPTKKDCDLIVEYLRLLGIHQKTVMTKDPNAIRDIILADCLQWFLMDENESGARFYESIGSSAVPAMSTFRMNEDALKQMAEKF